MQAGEDRSAIYNFVLFLIQVGVGIELDLRVILPLNRFKLVAFLLKEELHHFGMRSDTDASGVFISNPPGNGPQDLVADGGLGLDEAFAFTIGARFAERPGEAFSGSFSGHLHETQLGNLEYIGLLFVPSQCFLQCIRHLLPVHCPVHVDEINYDNPAYVSQAQLVGYFFDRFQVGFENGFLQISLAHVSACVYVNCHQGLSEVDIDVTP